jgi:hypothetical protein
MISGVFLFIDGDKIFGTGKIKDRLISWASIVLFLGGFFGLVIYKFLII